MMAFTIINFFIHIVALSIIIQPWELSRNSVDVDRGTIHFLRAP